MGADEFRHQLGTFGGAVGTLARILGQLEELRLLAGQPHELPLSATHGPIQAMSPIECVVRGPLEFTGQVGQEIHAVQVLGNAGRPGCRQGGGHEIQTAHGLLVDPAGGQDTRPLHQERHAQTALEGRALVPTKGSVVGSTDLRSSVVVQEDEQRVSGQIVLVECVQHATHCLVERDRHGRQLLSLAQQPGHAVQHCRVSLQGYVHSTECDVQEEGLCVVRFDETRCTFSELVRQVVELLGHGLAIQEEAVHAVHPFRWQRPVAA